MDGSGVLPYFEDFDKADVCKAGEEYILKADALNFAIEFDSDKALLALELNTASVQQLLQAEPGSTKTRWLGLWCPERQRETVTALATHYGFSPRLLGLMCQDPEKPVVAAMEIPQSRLKAMLHHWKPERASFESQGADLEMTPAFKQSASHALNLNLNHYRVVDQVWYYCSVDWGSKYLCVGYNSLSQLDPDPIDTTLPPHEMQNKPQAKRLWTWLIICDDSTIITINENPFPDYGQPRTPDDEAKLYIMRRHLLNVFQQLSKSKDAMREKNPMMALPIRSGLKGIKEPDVTATDAPSLLFHYLFDDWYTTYSLRTDMFSKPDVYHVEKLHHIGQQLNVLKKIYQSYALIIERILERQKPVDMSSSTQLLKEHIADDKSLLTAQTRTRTYAVPLSSAAIVRFERLRDRIQLYALGEIQDCIDEKEALVFLNFNLITLKQSDAVERLTRITILLAKVTILFMPVSLMTAYFSVQIEDLQGVYTSTTYWACFAIVMTLSFTFLVIFGRLSNTLEGKVIYKSMTQAFLESPRKFFGLKERSKAALKVT